MSPEHAAPDVYFADLFERTQQRLTERLGQAVGTILRDPAATPSLGGEAVPKVIAQLRLDEGTQQVVVRFCDAQTGATIRELAPSFVALAAAGAGRTM